MKMDRNIEGSEGRGKYAILNLRKLHEHQDENEGTSQAAVRAALSMLEAVGILEWGEIGSEHEFFLIKLKDIGAQRALEAYAGVYQGVDPEWSGEVLELAKRSGEAHPLCKRAD